MNDDSSSVGPAASGAKQERPRSLAQRILDDPVEVLVGGLFHRRLHPTLVETHRAARLQSTDPSDLLAELLPSGEPPIGSLAGEFEEAARALSARERPGLRFAARTAFLRGEAWVLYALVRRQRPEVVVETGVANGHSSSVLLEALRRNERGRLTSFDIEPGAGELVPPELRDRWDLRILPARRPAPAFERAMEGLERIGLFLHDSDHSYEWMELEFRSAWGKLAPGGFLAADDIDWSYAFIDFARKVGVQPYVLVEASKPFGILARAAAKPTATPAEPKGSG
ncbi:MAG: class I SAM-dependent methyltransferase [Thermoplasmata archaeon]|nr:class I SAM-dependent methyltransferase [Thermoplasmata archaeon]